MAKKASVEDLMQMFQDSVCMYKNKPYLVRRIDRNRVARCFNLLAQKEENIEGVDEGTFSAPTQRLGYANVHGGVVYLTRNPIRRYKVGISAENLVIEKSAHGYAHGSDYAATFIATLESLALGECIIGRYPTITEAFKSGNKIMAFDRQFAIDANGRVFYKNKKVGSVGVAPKSTQDIVFAADYAYLTTLLENNYEKAFSTSRA